MHAKAFFYLKLSLHVKIVSNTVRMHHLPSLFSIFSYSSKFQTIVTMNALKHCFHLFLYSSKSFQILSECMLQIHWFYLFLCCFKYRQNACFRDMVFIFFFGLQIFVWRVCITLKRNVFFSSWQTLQNIKRKSFKVCFKMSQNAAVAIQDVNIFRGSMPPGPLDQWCLHIDLSLATPLLVGDHLALNTTSLDIPLSTSLLVGSMVSVYGACSDSKQSRFVFL